MLSPARTQKYSPPKFLSRKKHTPESGFVSEPHRLCPASAADGLPTRTALTTIANVRRATRFIVIFMIRR
jgi:hypothetical protein